ncbi:MAG: NAD(P)-binding protein [Novosphingobium sp.]|nr:NAD(P)-binding protein [Novosphingobium sp.]
MQRVGIVGAGFTGAVIARELAEAGIASVVMDERSHVAGNCHTERDSRTGIMVHRYGPHIFHTDRQHVWDYVNRFGEMVPFILRVKTTYRGHVYSLPVNLHTINQFFGKAMRPDEARAFVESQARSDIEEPRSFEEQALRFIGQPLYEAFFRGYTRKQWGMEPSLLPASILKRLPLRFDYNDNYFNHPHQAIPRDGYSAIVSRIMDHPKIEHRLGCRFEDVDETFSHLFYSGGMDRYYRYALGRLGYRTLDFRPSYHAGDYQGTAIMNHPEEEVPFTRVTEHKHFAPWEASGFAETIVFHETSRACGPDDIPYYPIRLVDETSMLRAYEARAREDAHVTFVGRLGTYEYLDMDATIDRALSAAQAYLSARPA